MTYTAQNVKEMTKIPEVKIDIDALKEDVSLAAQGVDSLEMMNLMLALEEKLSIKIPDDDVEKMRTINDIVMYLNSRRKNE